MVETSRQVDLRLQLLEVRGHILRAHRIVEEQRCRMRRLRTPGQSMKLHEHLIQLFERSLAHMEKYERMLKAEIELARRDGSDSGMDSGATASLTSNPLRPHA